VVGGGYVGLVSACFYARTGHETTIVEVDQQRRAQIARGEPPFYERGLDSVLKDVISAGRLNVSEDLRAATASADATFITVGTPSRRDGSINLGQVRKASREIGEGLRRYEGYHHVVVRSTVVPGTTVNVVKPILEKRSGGGVGQSFGLAVQPEFLREGNAFEDMERPDRIVIGAVDDRTTNFLVGFYGRLHQGHVPPILTMNASTAEMVKYANNSFLACKISFINEIANICQRIPGADVVQVADAIGLDNRIGRSFLDAGLGFGGSCFPKDIRAMIHHSQRLRYSPAMLKAILKVNNRQPLVAVEMLRTSLGTLKGRRIAVLGSSFKPGTDDMREARSIIVIGRLLQLKAHVVLYDPKAMGVARKVFGGRVEYAHSSNECLAGADCAIVVTEWDEFKQLRPSDFGCMRRMLLVDGRRIYRPSEFADRIEFKAIGLGPAVAVSSARTRRSRSGLRKSGPLSRRTQS
jgi:UDPglucose 6-dehydrogenase